MRKLILVLLFSLLSSNLVYADGMILPGELGPGYLAVRYHRVTVSIEDGHAVTRVEQEFYNPHPVPVSARYLFPVPPEAMLSRFQATVDGVLQSPARQDAATTNAELYEIVAQRHDPSLLQYADWETLALDVNLPAGGSRRMSLEYEEVLAPVGGMYRYRYVLSTERYSSLPLDEVSVTVEVHSSSGLSTLYSATHPVSVERQGPDRALVRWEEQHTTPNEDFELFFAPSDGDFGSGLLTGSRDGQDHFLFLFAPQAETAREDAIPKDIVFVMDRSGSMSGDKIEQARNALRFILGQLDEDDRFSIVGFDDRLDVFAYSLQEVNAETLSDARWFVSRLAADGNTDLEAALQTGLDILERSEQRRSEQRAASQMVLFLTDGLPTAGVTDEGLIASLVRQSNARLEARLHVFGVGYDVNTHLLDRLAADNGGAVTYVQPGENLETVLTEFYGRIAQPVLTDVQVEFEGLEIGDLYPAELPDMFSGSSLLLTGRYRALADEVVVRVRGLVGAEEREFEYRFALAETGEHDFVPRLWATRRVGELLDQVRVEGESAELVDEIQEIGLAYGLVTPYTTVVIQAQAEGAASASNMALYDNQAELNQAWGQVTVQARVQNQLYQQADQASLANGANVLNNAQHSLAQVTNQNVDLSLLRGQANLDEPITLEWIERNVGIDQNVVFGSDEYFALADDPAARPFLQSGSNVVFVYQGQVIAVQDPDAPEWVEPEPQFAANQASVNQNQVQINVAPASQTVVANQAGGNLDWWDVLCQWVERFIGELGN